MLAGRHDPGEIILAVIVPFESPQGASLTQLADLVAPDMERVNTTILARTGSDVAMIPEVANHLISSGGKRLRPMLTLAMAKLAGYTGDGHIKFAAAVEFMHTATLLHDDVVDESDMRRGKLAARMLWGNEASVLVGRFPARPGLQDDGRSRQPARARYPLLRRRGHRGRRSDATRRRQEHRHQRGRIHGGDPRQDRGTVRRRLRGGPGAGGQGQGRARRLPLVRHEPRHRLPADRRRARLRRQVGQARQERRRRFPRRQDHLAGGAVIPPRHRKRARVLEPHARRRARSATAISTKR